MTKQDLEAALDIKRKLTRFENRLADLEATGGIQTSIHQTGGRGGHKGNAAAIAGELADEITNLRRQLEIEQTIIRRALEKLGLDETEKKLMMLRYVDCRPWQEVAEKMAYSKIAVMKKHAVIMKRILEGWK